MIRSGKGDFSIDPTSIPADLIYKASFLITLELVNSKASPTLAASAPYFLPAPREDLIAYIGKPFQHSFGPTYDLESDAVFVTADLGTATDFAKFNTFTNTLTIAAGATTVLDLRIHLIKIQLSENKPQGQTTNYKFRLVLEELLEEAQEPSPGLLELDGVVGTEA